MPADPRYPIGPHVYAGPLAAPDRAPLLDALAALPAEFRAAVEGLTDAQLDTPYRDGGWTVRQVAHHLPDSHANAYVRFKLALTEDTPTIKPYDEDAWARLPDAASPVGPSLALLDALHDRWARLLRALPDEAWRRAFVHPDKGRPVPLDEALSSYVWHGRHHTAHVTALRERSGW